MTWKAWKRCPLNVGGGRKGSHQYAFASESSVTWIWDHHPLWQACTKVRVEREGKVKRERERRCETESRIAKASPSQGIQCEEYNAMNTMVKAGVRSNGVCD